jgi:hypothetical protein
MGQSFPLRSGGLPTADGAAVRTEAVRGDKVGAGLDIVQVNLLEEIGGDSQPPSRPEGSVQIQSAALEFGSGGTIQQKRIGYIVSGRIGSSHTLIDYYQ